MTIMQNVLGLWKCEKLTTGWSYVGQDYGFSPREGQI
jgi:hypothetical protein